MRSKLMSGFLVILINGLFGFFTSLNAAPGDLDTSFAFYVFVKGLIGEKRNDAIRATAIQPDGKIVVAGTVYSGGLYCGVARYNPNGSLDNSFDRDGKSLTLIGRGFSCADVELQTDGKIIVAGYSVRDVYNFSSFSLARLNPDGSPDVSFGTNGKVVTDFSNSTGYAFAAALQPDGKIVLAGYINEGGNANFAVARYNPNGSLDSTFDQDGKVSTDVAGGVDHARTVYIQADGKILVGGNCADAGWVVYNDYALVRYNTDGSLDPTFGNGTGKVRSGFFNYHDNINTITVQTDGKIIAAGMSSGSDNLWYLSMVRYNANGSQDSSFQFTTLFKGSVSAIAVQSDGKIFVGGSIQNSATVRSSVIRVNSNGSLDPSFRANEIYSANTLSLQADGKVIIAGSANNGLSSDFGIVRYDSDGMPDASFDGDGKAVSKMGSGGSTANDVVIQADGKIIVVGEASNGAENSGAIDFAVARYNADGSFDTTFDGDGTLLTDFGDPSLKDTASAVALQSDGKIVVAGTANGYLMAIARYNAEGSLDNSFDGDGKWTSSPGSPRIYDVAIQPDGKIVAVGNDFQDVLVLRLNADGTYDQTFDGDGRLTTDFFGFYNDGANSVKIQPNGKILVSGSANNDDNLDFAIVRYNTDGSLDSSFDGDGKATVSFSDAFEASSDLVLQNDGKIIVTGNTGSGSNTDFAIARLNQNGSLDSTFDNDGKVITFLSVGTDYITNAAIQSNGKIVVAGVTRDGIESDAALVRYNADGSLDTGYGNGGIVTKDFSNSESPVFRDAANSLALDSNGRAVIAGNSGGVFLVARFLGDNVTPALIRSPFDFDGDGKTDVAIFRPATGEWWINRSSTNLTSAVQFGSSSDKLAPGDYTGDGKADIAFWRSSTGQWFIIRSEDNSFYAFPFGSTGDIPVPADFDGDGKTDAAVFRPSNQGWYIQKSSGGVDSITFGAAGDFPVVADYDGDGKADIAITRINNGSREWWIRRSSDGQISAVQFGDANDKAAAGDYTGDGKTDIAFWRPSNGFWYILRSENNSFYGFPFGTSGDMPTPGDYDGDGRFDAAVFRPSNSGWYLNRSTQGFTAIQFGIGSDIPVPSAFVP